MNLDVNFRMESSVDRRCINRCQRASTYPIAESGSGVKIDIKRSILRYTNRTAYFHLPFVLHQDLFSGSKSVVQDAKTWQIMDSVKI